jgi:nitrile hydratase
MTSTSFAVGDRVRIAARTEARHHRVPAYAKGRVGVVERVCGEHEAPERIAYGHRDAPRRLYRVRLRQVDLWPEYAGSERDHLEIEIFAHWLTPA